MSRVLRRYPWLRCCGYISSYLRMLWKPSCARGRTKSAQYRRSSHDQNLHGGELHRRTEAQGTSHKPVPQMQGFQALSKSSEAVQSYARPDSSPRSRKKCTPSRSLKESLGQRQVKTQDGPVTGGQLTRFIGRSQVCWTEGIQRGWRDLLTVSCRYCKKG